MGSIADSRTPKQKKHRQYRRNFPKWPLILTFSIIGLLGILGVVTLLYLSWYHTETNTQFFTDNVLNLLILGAIVVQAIIYTYQWIAMRDVVRQNERIIRASQRQARTAEKALKHTENILEQNERSMIYGQSAYVMAHKIGLMQYKEGARVEARIVAINTGTTPAYKVAIYGHLDFQILPFTFTHAEAKNITPLAVRPLLLGPNGDTTTQDVYTEWEPADYTVQRVLHFWGLITYEDIFGRERWTEFCYREVPRHLIPVLGDHIMAMNESNNDADKPDAQPKTKQDV